MEIVHKPVLVNECLRELSLSGEEMENGWLVDSTLGEGGHSQAFLERFSSLNVIGIDADSCIQKRAKERLACFGDRMHFYNGWFNDFYESYPAEYPRPNIILFDLGISVFHYERSGRGFSFRHDERLDMRLNPYTEKQTAEDIVNGYREEELANLIFLYGEEKFSRRIARAVCEERKNKKISTSKQLSDIIYDVVPENIKHLAIHPATKTFQALRIAVNDELGHIPSAIHNAFNVLQIGGKMGVITFHSLEDRIVKNYFRNLGKDCVCPPNYSECKCGGKKRAEILTKKPICPSDKEISENSPSRSAKLRVVRKLQNASDECKVSSV